MDNDTTLSNKRYSFPLQVKLSAKSQAGEFQGYASSFGGLPDAMGDVIAPGAFKATITDHRAKGTSPALLWCHSMQSPIGVVSQLREDSYGLQIDGKLALDIELARDCHALMKMGAVAFSIGYRAEASRPLGRRGRELTAVSLHEISIVSIPANTNARLTSVKARADVGELNSIRGLEQCLNDFGYSRKQAREIAFLGKAALRPVDAALADQILTRKLIAATAAINAFSH